MNGTTKGVAARRLGAVVFGLYLATAAAWLLIGLAATLVEQYTPLWTEAAFSGSAFIRALATPARPEAGAQVVLDYTFSVVNIVFGMYLFRLRNRSRSAGLLAVALIGTAAAFNLTAHRANDV